MFTLVAGGAFYVSGQPDATTSGAVEHKPAISPQPTPSWARELRIGRPDLSGDYDDGGLVDIAGAPGSVIAEVLELSPEQAAEIVAVRDTAITVDDLFFLTDLPISAWDRIRDRAVIIR